MIKSIFSALFASAFVLFIFSCHENGKRDIPENTDGKSWVVVFQDDFSGTKVNESDWSMYNSPGHAGNGLRRPEAFTVSDGTLVVTAQMIGNDIVSGGMALKTNHTYGKFEFRVRTQPDPSEATSGVILTWPQSERWPMDGENDMYETGTNADRNSFHTYIHYGTNPGTQFHFSHEADATQWHILAMEWEADSLKMYRDGALVWTLTDLQAIPDVPHHLCIQLDAFKKSMTGVVKMYVDWVKVYEKR